MYEERSSSIPTGKFDAHDVLYAKFARFDFPSPTGTIRYTEIPGGYTGDLGDGSGSVTWAHWDLAFEDISSSEQTIMDVSSIALANLENTWSTLVLNVGIEMRPVLLMQAWFDPPGPPVPARFQGIAKFYSGRMEVARIQDGICNISLVPHRSGMSQMLPARIIGPACGLPYGDPRTCQYPGPFTGNLASCDHSRAACKERNNLLHFGGEDLIPSEKLIWRILESG